MIFLNKDGFHSVRLLASHLTPKLEDHSWSAVHDCLFNIFAANLHIWRPTPPSATQGTCHAMVSQWKKSPNRICLCHQTNLASYTRSPQPTHDYNHTFLVYMNYPGLPKLKCILREEEALQLSTKMSQVGVALFSHF